LCNKVVDYKWALVVVYEPAQKEFKESFLVELVNVCSHKNLSLAVGGDFNILRHSSEKNNDHFHARWPLLFNVVIDGLNLKEIQLTR
jgi:hypothetical protein